MNTPSPVVLITGASSGIGEALAHEYAQKGARLALAARRTDRLETLAQKLRVQGAQVLIHKCDVSQDGDLERLAEATVREFGRIDIVIANAGFGVAGQLSRLTTDDYRRQFETNVFGVLRTVYSTLNELQKSQGTLVLLGSVAGYIALPGSSPYAMSKFSIHALARAIGPELRSKSISVVLLCPGFVESEIRKVNNHGVFQPHAQEEVPAWLVMPRADAAREMIRAIAKRKPEAIITRHGKILIWVYRHFPWVISFFASRGLRGRREAR